jgi:VWFA-related protein
MTRTAALAALLTLGLFQAPSAQQAPASPPAPASPQTPPPDGQPQPQQPAPTFRTDINFVRVDVIVTDGKQQPVTDLTQADFEVTEDGRPQKVEQFRLIRVDGNPRPGDPPPRQIRNIEDEQVELSREDSRVFVFFLDDYHVRLGNSIFVRDPLTRFVREQLRPNDIVGIMYPLTPVVDVSFTRNHAQVEGALQKFEGRKFDYRPRNLFEEQYVRYPTETVERVRNQVVMSALRGLATRLGGVREGRKSIIFVSEGLTASLPPQMRNQDALMGPMNNPAARNPSVGENSAREDTAAFFASTDLLSEMREVFTAANRNNTAIYSVDPRGLAVGEFGIDENIGPNQDRRALQMTQDTLRVFAEETDGRAIVNRNDLVAGMAQIVRDSSFYYLIGYTSSQAPSDGKFHEIKVNVKRRGVDVRSRKGYWALTVADTTRAATVVPETAKPIQQALASIAPSVQSGKYVRTWLGTTRGEGGKTRVTLIWEPLPQVPGVRRDPAGRVSLIAADAKGDLVFRGRSPDAAVASAAPAAATGAAGARVPTATPAVGPQRLVFDATPGQVELRLSVEGAEGGTLDQELRTITVPDLTGPDAGISTPRVHRVRTAREMQTVAADAAAVPVVTREFSRTERLLIRFDAYGSAMPTAILINRNGQKLADVPVTAAVAGGTHQIDLGLNTVAPGEYLVEISAGETKELIPFRIGA